ncbi:urea ABC transporter substrate-binding protein [Dietzia sp. PP-33]|jgi:urea transport system substrate-binding protein|uniref:urea ABC transporter substrate-binding protein n=1 Tax=Dietzia sp. PP-33 TaxID=2957500 RepID=UPI0029B2D80B|nr:urea ABC transporter substrate-binding protein [Dietzia sp. PP-33]MDX2356079.1 urea ABC transporter substrate-binding protein [Dietzia sp. PP-33]
MSPLKRSFVTATGVITVAALLTACGSRTSDDSASAAESCVDTSGDTIKVGAINSLSGGTAINETVIRDAITLAVEQINADGGVLDKQIELIAEDGASEPTVFAEKAEKLIGSDCVATVFGGYTSASRKAMLPVFESNDALLYYGQQYEGLESSPNIFYSGATTNQQIVPALDYLKEQGVESLYLVGSDYVFPHTANRIVKEYAEANDIEIRGEDYTPLGSTDFSTIINKIRTADADAVFNVVVGDSLVAFFREFANAGLTSDDMPVISMCVGEEEVRAIGTQNVEGHLASWNYYQTIDSPENSEFVTEFTSRFGENRVTSDPMESAYTGVYLWKAMVEKAGSFDVGAIQDAADGVTISAPGGEVTVDGENHHITKTARVGEIRDDGLIYTVWESDGAIEPDPYLETYDWAAGLAGE